MARTTTLRKMGLVNAKILSAKDVENILKKGEKCAFCGKQKRIGRPCTCKYGGVFG